MLCSVVFFYLLLQEERKFWTEVYRDAVIWIKEKDMWIIYIIVLEFSNFFAFVLISLWTIFYVQVCLRAKGCVNEWARAKTQGWWNCNCFFAGVFSNSFLTSAFCYSLSYQAFLLHTYKLLEWQKKCGNEIEKSQVYKVFKSRFSVFGLRLMFSSFIYV